MTTVGRAGLRPCDSAHGQAGDPFTHSALPTRRLLRLVRLSRPRKRMAGDLCSTRPDWRPDCRNAARLPRTQPARRARSLGSASCTKPENALIWLRNPLHAARGHAINPGFAQREPHAGRPVDAPRNSFFLFSVPMIRNNFPGHEFYRQPAAIPLPRAWPAQPRRN
jgi:hypothetical protein